MFLLDFCPRYYGSTNFFTLIYQNMIIVEKPYLKLEYDETMRCIIQHWKGFAKSAEFREGINKSLEFFKQKKVDKIISDTKNLSLVKKEDTDWVAREVTPAMVKQGLKYMAFIVPSSVFTQLSVDNYKTEANKAVTIRYFDQLAEAKAWLSEVK